MVSFIDLHFHLLFAVDDGPRTLEQSLEMAQMARAEGISKIVATPHPNFETGVGGKQKTEELVQKIQLDIRSAGINDLDILPGTECYLIPEIMEYLKNGQLITLNFSRYLLIEFPPIDPPVKIEYFIYSLRNAGYVPVIAHPERYRYVQDNAEWLSNLVRLGCLAQITAGALSGRFGKRCFKSAEELLKLNLCHVIASDAHNPAVRPPGFLGCLPELTKIAGPDAPARFLSVVPGYIISNMPYEPPQPEKATGKVAWKFW
jgi:protein-tyrosine phosphatase